MLLTHACCAPVLCSCCAYAVPLCCAPVLCFSCQQEKIIEAAVEKGWFDESRIAADAAAFGSFSESFSGAFDEDLAKSLNVLDETAAAQAAAFAGPSAACQAALTGLQSFEFNAAGSTDAASGEEAGTMRRRRRSLRATHGRAEGPETIEAGYKVLPGWFAPKYVLADPTAEKPRWLGGMAGSNRVLGGLMMFSSRKGLRLDACDGHWGHFSNLCAYKTGVERYGAVQPPPRAEHR